MIILTKNEKDPLILREVQENSKGEVEDRLLSCSSVVVEVGVWEYAGKKIIIDGVEIEDNVTVNLQYQNMQFEGVNANIHVTVKNTESIKNGNAEARLQLGLIQYLKYEIGSNAKPKATLILNLWDDMDYELAMTFKTGQVNQ